MYIVPLSIQGTVVLSRKTLFCNKTDKSMLSVCCFLCEINADIFPDNNIFPGFVFNQIIVNFPNGYKCFKIKYLTK